MNLRRALLAALSVAGAIAGLAFLAYVASPHWDSVRTSMRGLHAGWILLAGLALSLHYAITFGIWVGCMRLAGFTPTRRQAADTYIPSLLARYVPGKVWSHGVRLALARRAGISLVGVTGAVGWEILLSLAGASVVALVALAGAPIGDRVRAATAIVAALTAFAIAAAVVVSARQDSPLVRRLGLRTAERPWTLLAWIGAAHLVAWLVYGFAHWAIARGVVPVRPDILPLVTGAIALAWIGGYVAVFTPAGLGVREGLLALLLGPVLGAGPVVVMAAAARLLAIALETVLLAGWLWWRTRHPGPGLERTG